MDGCNHLTATNMQVHLHMLNCPVFKGEVAVKTPEQDADSLETLLEEGAILEKVKDANLVSLLGYVMDGDQRVGLILEACGGSLVSLSPNHRQTHAQTILRQIALALHELLKGKVSHHDLKPQNILVCYTESSDTESSYTESKQFKCIKLCDMGHAREIGTPVSPEHGTLPYMAPELWHASAEVLSAPKDIPADPSFDVYSFGVILWEFLTVTGESAPQAFARMYADFSKEDKDAFMKAQKDGRLLAQMMADVPSDSPWAWLVRQCLQSDPAIRIKMRDMLQNVEDLTSRVSETTSSPHTTRCLMSQPEEDCSCYEEDCSSELRMENYTLQDSINELSQALEEARQQLSKEVEAANEVTSQLATLKREYIAVSDKLKAAQSVIQQLQTHGPMTESPRMVRSNHLMLPTDFSSAF